MRPHLDFEHRPTRGSEVEKWIENTRDHYGPGGPRFDALDELLFDYRQRADYGVDLMDEV